MDLNALDLGKAATAVLLGTEGIGRAFKVRKDIVAMLVGPLAGVFLMLGGQLQTGIGPDDPMWLGYLIAAAKGLMASFGVTGVHTIQKQLRGAEIKNYNADSRR